MKTATQLPAVHTGWKGDARLYQLSEPIANVDKAKDAYPDSADAYDFIVVSQAWNHETDQAETLVFGTDGIGYPDTLWELNDPEFSGPHHEALASIGYTLKEN